MGFLNSWCRIGVNPVPDLRIKGEKREEPQLLFTWDINLSLYLGNLEDPSRKILVVKDSGVGLCSNSDSRVFQKLKAQVYSRDFEVLDIKNIRMCKK